MIAVLGLVVGVVVGLLVRPEVPAVVEPYLPIAVVAALDAVFGGLRAMLDGIFDDKVFVVSFLSNVVVAALIVFLGDKLGVGAQLSTGVVVVLGIRIFSNAAAIRRRRVPGVRRMSEHDEKRAEENGGTRAERRDGSGESGNRLRKELPQEVAAAESADQDAAEPESAPGRRPVSSRSRRWRPSRG